LIAGASCSGNQRIKIRDAIIWKGSVEFTRSFSDQEEREEKTHHFTLLRQIAPSAGVWSTGRLHFCLFVSFVNFVVIPLVILMFRKMDGGISVVAKKRSAIGTFF
jgi:hypothetical protein